MTRHDMLNEHLNSIYLDENFNQFLAKMESKRKNIIDSIKEKNILRFHRISKTMPEVPPSESKNIAKKRFKKEYAESEKFVNANMKDAPQEIKDSAIVLRATLNKIKSEATEPSIIDASEKVLKDFNASLRKSGVMLARGASASAVALLLAVFFGTPILLLLVTGVASILIGLIIATISFLSSLYVEYKKSKSKV